MDPQSYTLLNIPERIEDKDEKVKLLRDLRNDYYQKAAELQKQIDDRIMELHQVPDFNNKFIKYSGGRGETHYFKVSNFERLIKGIKITGFYCISSIYGSLWIYRGGTLLIDWDKVQDIVIIEECDFVAAITNAADIAINSYKDEI